MIETKKPQATQLHVERVTDRFRSQPDTLLKYAARDKNLELGKK